MKKFLLLFSVAIFVLTPALAAVVPQNCEDACTQKCCPPDSWTCQPGASDPQCTSSCGGSTYLCMPGTISCTTGCPEGQSCYCKCWTGTGSDGTECTNKCQCDSNKCDINEAFSYNRVCFSCYPCSGVYGAHCSNQDGDCETECGAVSQCEDKSPGYHFCDGNTDSGRCGATAQPTDMACMYYEGDGKCDTACGASSSCNDKDPGQTCDACKFESGNTVLRRNVKCSSSCQCDQGGTTYTCNSARLCSYMCGRWCDGSVWTSTEPAVCLGCRPDTDCSPGDCTDPDDCGEKHCCQGEDGYTDWEMCDMDMGQCVTCEAGLNGKDGSGVCRVACGSDSNCDSRTPDAVWQEGSICKICHADCSYEECPLTEDCAVAKKDELLLAGNCLTGGCSGTATDCGSLTQTQCGTLPSNGQNGCSWAGSGGGQCTGGSVCECGDFSGVGPLSGPSPYKPRPADTLYFAIPPPPEIPEFPLCPEPPCTLSGFDCIGTCDCSDLNQIFCMTSEAAGHCTWETGGIGCEDNPGATSCSVLGQSDCGATVNDAQYGCSWQSGDPEGSCSGGATIVCDSSCSPREADCGGSHYYCGNDGNGWEWKTTIPLVENTAFGNCNDGIDNDCNGLRDCEAGIEEIGCDCSSDADLALRQVRLIGPAKETFIARAVAEVDNYGPGPVQTFEVTFTVHNREDDSIVEVIDWDTKQPVTSMVVTAPYQLIEGVASSVEWTFQAPSSTGDYYVRANVADPDTPNNNINTVPLEVVEDKVMTGAEYPWVVLLLIVILVPLVAYYLRKKKATKEKNSPKE